MPEKTKESKPPGGFARLAFRFPILLYRWGLGSLLGKRFVLLTHTGRKSGLPRQTVLEVVRHEPDTGITIVASGFGENSDWCLNIQANPEVSIKLGRVESPAISRRLGKMEAGDELVDYSRRHPFAIQELSRFMGYRLDGSEEDVRRLGEILPMFSFQVTKN